MNRRSSAIQLIREAETGIRAIMEQALAERDYDDVAHLASLASSLSNLTNINDGPLAGSSKSVVVPNASHAMVEKSGSIALQPSNEHAIQVAASRANKRVPRQGYPFFERQGDRLVKIGWSKRDRTAYEHRVPRNVVITVAEALSAAMSKQGSLRMDEILPIHDGNRGETPSYQAYLVLAWLRDLGAVVRQGNDGYSLGQGRADLGDIDELWERTAERGHGHAA